MNRRTNAGLKKTSRSAPQRRAVIEPLEPRAYFAGVAFQPLALYAAGLHPDAIAAGDMNGDGHVDLVTANYADGTVTLLLNNGNGTFTKASSVAVGNGPESVAIADFNGDGHQDIVVANSGTAPFDKVSSPGDTLSILLGNGDGTFAPKTDLSAPGAPQSVIATDLNHDGRLDLVSANRFDNSISVWLGNGDGTFTFNPAGNAAVGFRPSGVASGDFNRDGNADLAVANNGTNTVSILLGNGDGSFQPAAPFIVNNAPRGIAVADVTADGLPDIITASFSQTVTVRPGLGNGSFGPPVYSTAGDVPFAVAVGDLNGDGRPEVVAANQHGNRVGVLVRSRIFNGFQGRQDFAAGAGPTAVVLADFNGDGQLDIATANFDFNNVGVLINKMQPTVTTLVTSQNPAPAGAAVQFTAIVRQDPTRTPLNFQMVGLVQLYDGVTLLAGIQIRPDGTAIFTRTNLAVGIHALSALYIGDNHYASSIALGAVTQTITPAVTGQALLHPIINSLSAAPTLVAGSHAAARVIIQNQGDTTASGVLSVLLSLSRTATIGIDDVPLVASIGNLTLTMTARKTVSFTDNFTIPDGVTPGDYFVLAQLVAVSGFIPSEVSDAPAVSATRVHVA